MPIRPENRDRYPPDWPQIRARILERAKHRCEQCCVRNGAWGYRDAGTFHRVHKQGAIEAVRSGREWVKPPFLLGGHRIIEIVLTIAHLDHQPENCDPSNLRALCQRCHLAYDHEHHQQTAYATRREGRAIDMFGDAP
jgi:hypothetical protein